MTIGTVMQGKNSSRCIRILCLANSRKHQGRCLAGICLDTGAWVRPVSNLKGGELFQRQYCDQNGNEANTLDILILEPGRPVPKPLQPENVQIGKGIQRIERTPPSPNVLSLLAGALEPGPAIFGNQLDYVPYEPDKVLQSSLALILPRALSFSVVDKSSWGKKKPKVRVVFQLAAAHYSLSLTDPVWEEKIASLSFGTHTASAAGINQNQEALLCVSLGEPFEKDQRCYKLISGIILLPAGSIQRALQHRSLV